MNQRLLSLDAFRGFAIAAMLLVNNPGDWNQVYGPLLHAPWHGWTITDWIFPFFIFISGLAMQMSLARRGSQTPEPKRRDTLLMLMRRGCIILLIGLALNALPALDWQTLRWPGVLQRIGLCFAITGLIAIHWRATGQRVWLAVLGRECRWVFPLAGVSSGHALPAAGEVSEG